MRPLIARVPPSSDFMSWHQVFTQKQYEPVLQYLPRNARILDLGANVGYSARYFQESLPESDVFAVELDPDNYDLLTQNFDGEAINAGVWSRDCELGVHKDKGDTKEWSYYAKEESGTGLYGYSVSSLLTDVNWGWVDLIKMDIEGGEREVFKDPSWLLKTRVLAIEIHDDNKGLVLGALDKYEFSCSEHGELMIGVRHGL